VTANNLLEQGIAALKAGRKAKARNLLMQVVQQDKRNEVAWLWLSGTVDTDKERRICLENVLAINPNNEVARRGLASLTAKEDVRPLSAVSSPTPRAESAAMPRAQPIQPSAEVSAPDVTQRKSRKLPTRCKKAAKKRTGLMVGLGAMGLVLVCVALAGIWWAIDSGLLRLGPVVPATAIPTATLAPAVPSGWAKYTHFTGNFSVYYPPSWRVKSEDSDGVSLEASDLAFAGITIDRGRPYVEGCQAGDDECILNALARGQADVAGDWGYDYILEYKGIWDDGVYRGYVIESRAYYDTYDGWCYTVMVTILNPNSSIIADYSRCATTTITVKERETLTQLIRSIRVASSEQ